MRSLPVRHGFSEQYCFDFGVGDLIQGLDSCGQPASDLPLRSLGEISLLNPLPRSTHSAGYGLIGRSWQQTSFREIDG